MLDIKCIKIDGKNKTKEEIKKEVMSEIDKIIDDHKKQKDKPCIKLAAYMEGNKIDGEQMINGSLKDIMTILTIAVSNILHTITEECSDDEIKNTLLPKFIGALTETYFKEEDGDNNDEE